jgi:hypothetical protein
LKFCSQRRLQLQSEQEQQRLQSDPRLVVIQPLRAIQVIHQLVAVVVAAVQRQVIHLPEEEVAAVAKLEIEFDYYG